MIRTTALTLAATLALVSCDRGGGLIQPPVPLDNGNTLTTSDPAGFQKVASDLPRRPASDAPASDVAALVRGNTDFAFDLYRQVREPEKNLFFSPYSMSTALAMTWAGARGETAAQMASALRFSLAQDRLHPAFNRLEQTVTAGAAGADTSTFQLHTVNTLWGQKDLRFEQPFLDVVGAHYGAGMNLLDYVADPERCRSIINTWVSGQTRNRIIDLLPQESITVLTRLVLTNAIYFKARWLHEFDSTQTRDGRFTTAAGATPTVKFMNAVRPMPYVRGPDYCAVDLAYAGGKMSMTIVLPDSGALASVEGRMDGAWLTTIFAGLSDTTVALSLPRFEYPSGSVNLNNALAAMGMPLAFSDAADFLGMTMSDTLKIGNVFHKAFVAVGEKGTEAAAATAVIMSLVTAIYNPVPRPQPIIVNVNRPFVFIIRDKTTNALLFAGRIADPTAG